MQLLSLLLAAGVASCSAFAPPSVTTTATVVGAVAAKTSPVILHMANEQDLLRWARASRSAGVDDRVVNLKRPLGLVLNQDDDGNVFVETVAAKGNAARSGNVSSDC